MERCEAASSCILFNCSLRWISLSSIDFLSQLDIAHDKFIRTTDPKHEAIVRQFYSRVLAKGDIYRADYEGLYCVNCEEYKVFNFYSFYKLLKKNNLKLSAQQILII